MKLIGEYLHGFQYYCRAPEKLHFVRLHALEPQIHPLDFHSVREIYPLKSLVGSENTL